MIGDRLRETFYFFQHNLGPLLLVSVPFGLAAALLGHAFGAPISFDGNEQPRLEWRSALPILLLEPFALALRVEAIHRLASGQALDAAGLPARALALWPVMAVVGLLMSLAVGAGALLYIIPGIYLYARLGLAPVLVVTESKGPLEAISESWARTGEQQLEWFLLILLLVGGLLAITAGLDAVTDKAQGTDALAGELIVNCVGEALFVLPGIAFYRIWSLTRRGA